MGEKGGWCGICAKYLAFGTYPTSTVGALRYTLNFLFLEIFFRELKNGHYFFNSRKVDRKSVV